MRDGRWTVEKLLSFEVVQYHSALHARTDAGGNFGYLMDLHRAIERGAGRPRRVHNHATCSERHARDGDRDDGYDTPYSMPDDEDESLYDRLANNSCYDSSGRFSGTININSFGESFVDSFQAEHQHGTENSDLHDHR